MNRLSESRRRLAAKHWPMALGVASWFRRCYPGLPADWEGAAAYGLCRAAVKYEHRAGAGFRFYAWRGARLECRHAARVELAHGLTGLPCTRLTFSFTSLDPWDAPEDSPLAAWVEHTTDRHDDRAATEAAIDVRTLLGRLEPREARILGQRYGLDGEGRRELRDVGREIGLSGERVRQIEANGLARLRSAI
jgi:RNA polymerase sigma factor (sigma-70 family)